MPIVDFHNHYYPPEYLDALGPEGSTLTLTTDDQGNPVVHYPGDYNVMVRGHRDIAYRQEVLDEHGVDTQVISLTTPGTHVETPAVAERLARITNDADFQALFEHRYRDEPFVDVLPPGSQPETRWVRGTNQCRLAVHRPFDADTLVIVAVEDNLVKGAAGQAVQNMNLMFGFPESAGLEQIALFP